MRRRPVVMTRPATVRSRSRSRLGSQVRAGCSLQARSWVQVRSSAASWASSSQIWFLSKACRGRLVAPVSFRLRMRSSARARSRWVTSRSASRPAGVGGEHGDPPALVVGDPQLGTGVGAFAAGDDPHPRWPALEGGRQPPGQLGDLGALTRLPVGIEGLPPRLLRQHLERVQDRLPAVDTDRVLQTQAVDVPHEPLHPGAGVATDQDPRAQVLGQLGQGGVEHLDLVGGVVGSWLGLPRPQQPGQRLTTAAGTVVDEGKHRVEPEPAFEVRGRMLLSECAPISVASRSRMICRSTEPSGKGERCDQTRARAAARAARSAAIASSGCSANASTSRLTVGSEATVPNNSGWARTTPMSARQSPPRPIATTRSRTVLPGSWTERAARHGANPSLSASASPLTRAVASSIAAPAEEISDSPPDSTRTPEPAGITFTYGVPFRAADFDLRQAKFSKQDRHFRALRAERHLSHVKDRG